MKKSAFVILLLAVCFPGLIFAEEISGSVTLPDVSRKGNLYVVLYPFVQGVLEMDYYVMIPAQEITSATVSYDFADVEPGTYLIEAIWDIAEPFAEVSQPRGSHITTWPDEEKWVAASIFPQKGDYRVSTRKKVEISKGESLQNINIECTTAFTAF